MSSRIEVVAFDADDTLWHNETLFRDTAGRFTEILSRYCSEETIAARLFQTEMRNLEHYGYGIKSFTLSMIETAIELTDGEVSSREIAEILGFARSMLNHPVELLEGVEETIGALESRYRLLVVTKGDLLDQQSKLARSGLGDRFEAVRVVTSKDRATYESIVAGLGIPSDRFVMVGNSLKSDVIPALEAGTRAIHVPYHTEWAHEVVDPSVVDEYDITTVERITRVPEILGGWC